MFVPRLGQRLLMAIAFGLFVLPTVSWATTITITAPFDATSSTQSLNAWTINADSNPANNKNVFIANDGAGPPPASPPTTYFSTLNLTNNYMVIHPDLTGLTTVAQKETAAVNAYNLINDMVRSGYNVLGGAAWSGTGVTSTFTQHDPNQTLGIGVILNDGHLANPADAPGTVPLYGDSTSEFGTFFNNGSGAAGTTALTPYDTLVRYTWYGDTLLLGTVQNSDVNAIVANQVAGLVPTSQTWANGDQFYFAGFGAPIDNTDVNAAVASTVFIANGTYNSGIVVTYAQPSSLSVPEPSSVALAFMGGLLALAGLSRSRKRKCEL